MIKKSAGISDCGEYRYWLTRAQPHGVGRGRCTFIMLNPSTADAEEDDPTIRRCMNFAWSWGFNNLLVLNLFAYRATSPKDLKIASDPVGPNNKHYFKISSEVESDRVICAWGAHGSYRGQDKTVLGWLFDLGVTPMALKLTKCGHPGHPLYLPKTAKPFVMSLQPTE